MARLISPNTVRLGAVTRTALEDWLADWVYARTRVVFTVLGLWIMWTIIFALFVTANLAVARATTEISVANPLLARWTDQRAWDGASAHLSAAERFGPGDPCAPATPAQWRSDGGWRPSCLAEWPDESRRIARVAAPDSLLSKLTLLEVQLMQMRREGAGTASLVNASRVPHLQKRLADVRLYLRPIRIAGWVTLLVSGWVLFAAVAANDRRRDPTFALRETLGQRRTESWWVRCVSMALWTFVCSGIPLLAGSFLGIPNVFGMTIAAVAGFLTSIALLATTDWRTQHSRSLAERLAAGSN